MAQAPFGGAGCSGSVDGGGVVPSDKGPTYSNCGLACGFAIAVVRVYQQTLSPLFGVNCRYYPTCSEYMVEALRRKGFFYGLFKGLMRILRCNPFVRGGYDPVD